MLVSLPVLLLGPDVGEEGKDKRCIGKQEGRKDKGKDSEFMFYEEILKKKGVTNLFLYGTQPHGEFHSKTPKSGSERTTRKTGDNGEEVEGKEFRVSSVSKRSRRCCLGQPMGRLHTKKFATFGTGGEGGGVSGDRVSPPPTGPDTGWEITWGVERRVFLSRTDDLDGDEVTTSDRRTDRVVSFTP